MAKTAKSDSLACYTNSHCSRILFYTENKLDRNYTIWQLSKTTDMFQREIAEFIGCCPSVVNRTLLNLKMVGDDVAIEEYFEIAFALADILRDWRLDPDKYVTNIVNSLYRHGICSREKLKVLNEDEVVAFTESRDMRRAGKEACSAIIEYWTQLKPNNLYFVKGDI